MIRIALLRLLESYFRHRWLYLVPIVIMLTLGIVYTLLQEPVYITTGIVRVQEESLLASLTSIREGDLAWVTPAEAMVDELADLLHTDAFVRALIRETDLEQYMDDGPRIVSETIEEARTAVWAEPFGNNQVVIYSGHEDPRLTYQLVNATIEGFIQWQINADQQESAATQAFFSDLTRFHRTQLDDAQRRLEEYLTAHPLPLRGERPETEKAQIKRLENDIDIAEVQYRQVLGQEQEARLAMVQAESDARQTYFLIDAPTMPTEPQTSLRKTVMDIATYGVMGVVLSVVAVAGGAVLDRTLRFPLDVELGLDLPVLGVVPLVTDDETPAADPVAPVAAKRREGVALS